MFQRLCIPIRACAHAPNHLDGLNNIQPINDLVGRSLESPVLYINFSYGFSCISSYGMTEVDSDSWTSGSFTT